jgi:hypothetical protein
MKKSYSIKIPSSTSPSGEEVVSADSLEELESILEDIAIAPMLRERIAEGSGEENVSLESVMLRFGINPDDYR